MKKVNRILLCVLAGWVAWLLVNTEALSGGFTVDGSLATVNIGSNQIIIYPHAGLNVERLVLTVSGPGDFYSQQSFPSGATPYFSVAGAVSDGQYTYELLGVPALMPEDRERLAEARKTGDDSVVTELRDAGRLPEEKQVQSGHFFVQEGRILTADHTAAEINGERDDMVPIIPADQQILDDLIVTNSICVGFDCANGESFGFDTFRLKENNLRIHFMDTSNTASFPSNDWRLVANDTVNGGADYFAIEDSSAGRRVFSVEAGARSNALYVRSNGSVGLGTSTPIVELHIVDGDSPTVRLDQDGSSGWTAQRWDILGNETNFFIRDVTNGSKLSFRIEPGAPSNSLTIKKGPKIGINTWSPTAMLQVGTDTGTNPAGQELAVYGDAYIQYSLEIGSSREIKENINALPSNAAVAALMDLKPVKFNYKSKSEEQLGFIAEDVPELVATKSRKSLDTMDIVAVLTRVVQEQQKTIADLNRRLDALENKDLKISY